MKAEFNLKQEVWFMHESIPIHREVWKRIEEEGEGTTYVFKFHGSRKEEYVGATKEELKNKIFK